MNVIKGTQCREQLVGQLKNMRNKGCSKTHSYSNLNGSKHVSSLEIVKRAPQECQVVIDRDIQ